QQRGGAGPPAWLDPHAATGDPMDQRQDRHRHGDMKTKDLGGSCNLLPRGEGLHAIVLRSHVHRFPTIRLRHIFYCMTTATLPDAVRAGDPSDVAIPRLLEAHGGKLYALALRLTGNSHDAED